MGKAKNLASWRVTPNQDPTKRKKKGSERKEGSFSGEGEGHHQKGTRPALVGPLPDVAVGSAAFPPDSCPKS